MIQSGFTVINNAFFSNLWTKMMQEYMNNRL